MRERKEPGTSPRCLSARAICGEREGSSRWAHFQALECEMAVESEGFYIKALASDSVMRFASHSFLADGLVQAP